MYVAGVYDFDDLGGSEFFFWLRWGDSGSKDRRNDGVGGAGMRKVG
jgi:hypothetical protein